MSGYSEDAIRRSGSLPLHGALLEKPFTLPRLCRAVRAVLDRDPARM